MAQEIRKSTRKIDIKKPSDVTKFERVKYKDVIEPNFYRCPCCGKDYDSKTMDKNFPSSNSELYAGWNYHIPICKKCLDAMFEHYTEVYGNNEDKAIRRICEKYDYYYNLTLLNASRKITKDRSRIHAYVSRSNIKQYAEKTYDTTLDEERHAIASDLENSSENIVTSEMLDMWGRGFHDEDYKNMDEHYKMLKQNNPNADNNQEIFIKQLCNLYMLEVRALQKDDSKEYATLVEQYAKAFKQAGLKTIKENDKSADESLGVTLATISKYTPEEYYKDRKLYKDYDGLGEYFTRFVLRPLKNLMHNGTERDKEYYVKDPKDTDISGGNES